MRQKLLALLFIFSLSSMLFGCGEKSQIETIKVSASDEQNCIDKRHNELEEVSLKEPSEALAKQRREALIKAFETGEGCPNCEAQTSCNLCTKEKTCSPNGTCILCKEGKPCPLEQS